MAADAPASNGTSRQSLLVQPSAAPVENTATLHGPNTPARSYAREPASSALRSAARSSISPDEDDDDHTGEHFSLLAAASSDVSSRPLPRSLTADLEVGSAANRWIVFWSSVSLVVAVASMSAVGPLFLYLQQRGISAMLACSWRNQTMVLFLLVPTLIEWFRLPASQRTWEALRVQDEAPLGKESPKEATSPPPGPPSSSHSSGGGGGSIQLTNLESARKHHRNGNGGEAQSHYSFPTTSQVRVTPRNTAAPASRGWHVSWYLLVVCLTWAGSLVLWVVALPYTSTPRASLFCSTYPLLLVPYMKYVQKVPVSAGEVLGVAISFVGILTSEMGSLMGDTSAETGADTKDAAASDSEWTPGQRQLYGDLLCVGSSLLLGINIVFAEKTRKVLPLFSYTFVSAVVVLVLLVLGAMVGEGATWSTDPLHGVFGWVQGDMLWLNLAFGFVVGLIGVLGFNFAVKYVSPLIFSSTQLLDPGLTGVMSWMAGLEGFPSASTILGVLVVTVGIGCITVGQHKREHEASNMKSGTGAANSAANTIGVSASNTAPPTLVGPPPSRLKRLPHASGSQASNADGIRSPASYAQGGLTSPSTHV